MAKRQAASKSPKKCSCGATTAKEHIQACMLRGTVHPYTGPNR